MKMIGRRLLIGVLTLLTAATGLALTGPPAGAVFYIGTVNLDCQQVAFPSAIKFDRDNNGNKTETIRVQVVDATGLTVLDASVTAPLGVNSQGLGTFRFQTPPTANPVTVQLISMAGNKLPAKLDLSVQRTCQLPAMSFVRALYTDLLGRLPTDPELKSDLRLISGGGRAAVVNRVVNSAEHLGRLVNKLYIDTLGRSGDKGGINYWISQIQQGRRTLSQVTASFYASHEYYRGFGGNTDQGWVRDLYVKLLRRTPDAYGVSYWSDQARRTRTPVALTFFQSNESKRARITALYNQLLGRSPTGAEVNVWTGQLATTSDLSVEASLAGSEEYARRATVRGL